MYVCVCVHDHQHQLSQMVVRYWISTLRLRSVREFVWFVPGLYCPDLAVSGLGKASLGEGMRLELTCLSEFLSRCPWIPCSSQVGS